MIKNKPMWNSAHECYLKPCPKCKVDHWIYVREQDCGDWEEEIYDCKNCGHRIYVELPD